MSMDRLIEAAEIEALSEGEWDDLRPFSEASTKGAKAAMKLVGNQFDKKDRPEVEALLYNTIFTKLRDLYRGFNK